MTLTSGRSDQFKPRPGFQGSETTGAEVIIYPQGGDPVTIPSERIDFSGRRKSDAQPSLVAVSTQKMLGAAAGTWSVTCKPGKNEIGQSLFNQIVDDDWIDIVLTRHARRFHVMRGLVGSVRESRIVSGTGATSTSFVISGTDFGSIWEKTAIWFNPYSSENLGGAISQKVFSAMQNNLGSPKKAVLAFLQDMFREIGALGRATWVLPNNLPNRGNGSFIEGVDFNTDGYPVALDSRLVGLSQNWLMPQGNLWQLAKEWSDPLFNELFCDIFPSDSFGSGDIGFAEYQANQEIRETSTRMTLVFREKPFPTLLQGSSSPWFSLPLFNVPREQLVATDIGKSGAERYNAYFVAPQLTQELLKQNAVDLLKPLWSPEDIDKHGFRRFDVMSKYNDTNADLLTISSEFREKVRDWYCVNPYLLNGTLSLGIMRPDIRIGTRARIPGARSKKEDETYYIEQVSHDWQFGRGGRTNLGVTRGFIGEDNDLQATLISLASYYESPLRAQPGVSV